MAAATAASTIISSSQGIVTMVWLLVFLTGVLAVYLLGFWSTRIFPTTRPFRYNKAPDVHLPEARKTMLHNTFNARYHLDQKLDGLLTDGERIEALCHWVHSLWQPQPGRFSKSDNPLTIVSRAQKGERFARADYNIVLGHALMSIGIPTRLTTLRTRDAGWRPLSSRYYGLEYFDRDHFKWVWLDGHYGVRVLQGQIPLNTHELKDAIITHKLLDLQPDFSDIDIENYLLNLAPYLDIVVSTPIGQTKKYALIPPQIKLPKKKWYFGEALYDTACHSLISFYASHPIKQVTHPNKTQAVDIRTGLPIVQS